MKKILFILCLLFSLNTSSQCVSNQSFWINPVGPYSPGQVVTINYTLGGTQGGYWLWDLQNTFPSGLNFGPGWRFVNSSWWNPDWGSSAMGPFTMRFRVTVGQTCTPDNLSISISVFGDCLTGGWNNGACCSDPAYQIYNGVVQVPSINTSLISHY